MWALGKKWCDVGVNTTLAEQLGFVECSANAHNRIRLGCKRVTLPK